MKNHLKNHQQDLNTLNKEIEFLLSSQKSFIYPFGEKVVRHFKNDRSISLFTYGSLLNESSALRTMKKKVFDKRVPSVTFGFKRIFNRDVDVTNSTRYATPVDKRERGMLNLLPTGDNEDKVNGFIFQLDVSGINAMCEREVGYDLVPCVVTPWSNFKVDDIKISDLNVAYTFLAPSEMRGGIYPVSDDITPVKEYFDLVKTGASRYGDDFLHHWYETTVLADGETSVAQWERAYRGIG